MSRSHRSHARGSMERRASINPLTSSFSSEDFMIENPSDDEDTKINEAIRRIEEMERLGRQASIDAVWQFTTGAAQSALATKEQNGSRPHSTDSSHMDPPRRSTISGSLTHERSFLKDPVAADEAMAKQLAREWRVASMQSTLLKIPSPGGHSSSASQVSSPRSLKITPLLTTPISLSRTSNSMLWSGRSGQESTDPTSPHVSLNRLVSSSSKSLSGGRASPHPRHIDLPPTEVNLMKYRPLFTRHANCSACRRVIPLAEKSPINLCSTSPSQLIQDTLHMRCSTCNISHCRGCLEPIKCPHPCVGPSCPLPNCCPEVSAVAIFELLSAFDVAYDSETRNFGSGGKDDRQGFNELLISGLDPSTKTMERVFISALRAIYNCLPTSPEDTGVHPTIILLFSMSYLPEVLESFLSNQSVASWISHSNAYEAILWFLRRAIGCGLGDIIFASFKDIRESCGLHRWMWQKGGIKWEITGTDTDSSRAEVSQSRPLGTLMVQLEQHRNNLLAAVSKIRFAPTVEKVHVLSDGITFLLLQSILAERR